MKPHFLVTEVHITDRHTEPLGAEQLNELKQEVMTVELQLVGSGNTTNIKNPVVVTRIFEKLDTNDIREWQ